MRHTLLVLFSVLLAACVSGPPHLSPAQISKAENLKVYMSKETVNRAYKKLDIIEAVDCSSIKGVSGHDSTALFNLKKKAVYIKADAIIDVSCRTAPLVNDCWAPKSCTGVAIQWNN